MDWPIDLKAFDRFETATFRTSQKEWKAIVAPPEPAMPNAFRVASATSRKLRTRDRRGPLATAVTP